MCIERPRVLRRLIKHSSSRKMFTDGEPELVGLEGRPVPGMKAGCWGQDGWSCGCPKVSKRKGGSLGIAVPSVSSVERTGCLHVPSLQAQQGGGRRVRGWQCPGSGEKCIVLDIQRLSQHVVDRQCWRRWDGQEPYSAGLVLRQVWGWLSHNHWDSFLKLKTSWPTPARQPGSVDVLLQSCLLALEVQLEAWEALLMSFLPPAWSASVSHRCGYKKDHSKLQI